MVRPDQLSLPPQIELEPVKDTSPADPGGFLRLRRAQYRAHFAGQTSALFPYDRVERRAMDASIIVAHFKREGERWVYLRSALRPPLLGVEAGPSLWELPAGLIEPEEVSDDPARACAARETEEELGFRLPATAFTPLGPPVFPAPGMIAERQYFFEVEVEPSQRGEPQLDGSPLEQHGEIITAPVVRVLQWCRQGQIPDSKTELGLRRLVEACALRE